MPFKRLEHAVIGDLLHSMNHRLLLESGCWFADGTAIVMKLGEYRRSLDVDFLCSRVDGYRDVRNAFFEEGIRCLFPETVTALRDLRADAYGIRTLLEFKGQAIKFEIIREARIGIDGRMDEQLGVPTLLEEDMFAEKLLANADRCWDRSVAYRDAIDLGKLTEARGEIPASALAKAQAAYGRDIERKAVSVVNRLHDPAELKYAYDALAMDAGDAVSAVAALRSECKRLWPAADIPD